MNKLDVVIPVKDEAENVEELITRIHSSLSKAKIRYRMIFVDDHSSDDTVKLLEALSKNYPIEIHKKKGKIGKAYSILEGSKKASAKYIAMIDGDLQYPPEALVEMYKIARNHGVVVANRNNHETTFLRKVASKANSFIFGRLLLGIKHDTQSGLKVFRRDIIGHIGEAELSKWTLDMHLLHTALDLGYSIGCVDIGFEDRKKGTSKLNVTRAAAEIGFGAIRLRLRRKKVYHLAPESEDSMLGAGIAHKKRRFITHTILPHHHSALVTLTRWQKIFIFAAVGFLAIGLLINAKVTAIAFIAVLSTIYFLDVLFSLFVLIKSLRFPPEIKTDSKEIKKLKDDSLPIYSILCPLYREAKILPHFLEAIDNIDWPKEKLDVLLLLEEDDRETLDAAERLNLPSYIRTIVVPHSEPKTKPKACNYGLAKAKGEYVVIYDAEDRPDPLQLKKAYLAFQKADPKVFCLQSKLNYYNPHHNLLTRLFTAEYSLWFDVILPGLQSIETNIPLGGTSNHFRTKDLKGVHAWDPFNVTEDCDLGARIFKAGYKTAMIDSTTFEEANSNVKNWLRQRSRWIKGYLQTYLVHMRDPIGFAKSHGVHSLIFQLIIGMRISFLLINPLLWMATLAYFALYSLVGPAIESLYPAPVFYIAVVSLVFGNFMYLYNYMIGCAKRGHWSLIKYVFLVPFYWLLSSIGAAMAVYQLAVKPHYWEKTDHGFHLDKTKATFKEVIFGQSQIRKVREFAGSTIAGGGALIGASVIGNLANFLYNAYLGRSVSVEEFGLVSVISSLFYLTGIITGSFGRTVTYKSAYLFGKYNRPVKRFWASIRKKSVLISLGLTVLWIFSIPLLAEFFKADSVLPFVLFTPIWIVGLVRAADRGFLGGSLKFRLLGIIVLTEAVSKLAITYVFVTLGFNEWIYAAIPASVIIAFFVGWAGVSKLETKPLKLASKRIETFPMTFFGTSVLIGLSTVAFLSLDVVLARIYLSPTQAGEYALLSLSGKTIFFFGALFAQFINPLVSHKEGARKDSKQMFYKLLLVTSLASIIGFVAIGILGEITVPFLFGPKTKAILPLLPIYSFGITGFTVATSIVVYHQIKKQYLLPVVGFMFAIIQVAGIMLAHGSVESIATLIGVLGIVYLVITVVLHLVYEKAVTIGRNLADILGVFAPIPPREVAEEKLRILVLNWRDTKHVWGGAAEVYIHELAKQWIAKGHRVTVFCGNDGKCPRNEVVEGVQVVRRGGFYTVYLWAFLYYIFRFRGHYDVVIDCENGIPFFTPLYVKIPKFLVIHHVHQEIFMENLKAPFSWIALFLEARLMPLLYQGIEVITVSESSKKAIMRYGLTKSTPIVIPNGVDLEKYIPGKKAKMPLILYLGRLKPYKNLPVLIEAFDRIIQKLPKVKLVIAGFGESRNELELLVRRLKLEKNIKFEGRVSERRKVRLYQQAWVSVNPSSMEGWSVTSIEANACATPIIASDVPGLRDSVRNPRSGYLVEYDNPQAFADCIFRLITNRRLREDLSESAREWATSFRWEKSAERFIDLFNINQKVLEK